MFRLDLGQSPRYCDGISRRSFLTLGATGMATLALPQIFQAKAKSAEAGVPTKDTSVILIWLDGGPSHLDMYDMKPDAPAEYRGIWNPIRTRVPGFDITELFPRQAQCTNLFSVVRSIHHNNGDHFSGGHLMLTAKHMGVSGASNAQRFPGIGAIAARELGSRKRGIPAYVGVPHAASIGLNPGYFGGHFLGAQYNPFQPGGDPNQSNYGVQNLNLAAGLSLDRLEQRRGLSQHFDTWQYDLDQRGIAQSMDRFSQEAFEFVVGGTARRAFDLAQESPALRDRYGRSNWGQSTLLARRLVEAGSTFVTVHFGGWDHHWNLQAGYEDYLPRLDRAVSALFEDLDNRGLLEKTLVVMCGEFGRTPRMNDGGNGGAPRSMGTPGRDHWGDAMFCLLGGGGVQGGRIVGSTDRNGTRPASRPLTPSHLHATIYEVLGIDPTLALLEPSGRPTHPLDDPTPIRELF